MILMLFIIGLILGQFTRPKLDGLILGLLCVYNRVSGCELVGQLN